MIRQAFTLLLLLTACDKEAPKPQPTVKSAEAPKPSASTPAAPADTKVQLAVDDSAAYVSGERVDFATGDAKGRISAALASKSVTAEPPVLEAAREAKMPKVEAVIAALYAAKAKSVKLRTPKRDRVTAELEVVLEGKHPPCEAVGFIAKDGAINAWPASGATAARFTRGMAGPDLTRGSEGVRKLAASCDAPAFAVSGDESVTWGLVFDLALAVNGAEDGGTPAKAKAVTILAKTPTPGRKIDDD